MFIVEHFKIPWETSAELTLFLVDCATLQEVIADRLHLGKLLASRFVHTGFGDLKLEAMALLHHMHLVDMYIEGNHASWKESLG
jgi:hypothetical protein